MCVCVPGFHSGERGTMTMGGEGGGPGSWNMYTHIIQQLWSSPIFSPVTMGKPIYYPYSSATSISHENGRFLTAQATDFRPKKCPKSHLSASLIAFRWECFSPSMIRRVGGVAFLPSKNWVTPWIRHGYTEKTRIGYEQKRGLTWIDTTWMCRAPTWSILLTWLCLAQSYYLHQSNPHSSWGTWIILAATIGLFGIHDRPILDIFSGKVSGLHRFTLTDKRTWKLTWYANTQFAIKTCNLR